MKIPFQKHPSGAGFRAFFPTKSGEFNLSVVAGKDFYSTPRSDEDNPETYTEVELAIFTPEGKWTSKNQLKMAFEILGEQGEHEYNQNMESPSVSVWGWVPIEKIKELWEKL